MSASTATVERIFADRYRHEALLYSGMDEFLEGTLAFVRDGIAAGEPVLVVVQRAKVTRLRRELGSAAASVSFADMAEVGRNPARIIAAWQAFVSGRSGAAGQVRGVGEPIYAGRSPAEIAECQLHESLLNVAFDSSTPFWLLCPYDLETLGADVLDEARATHPYLARGSDRGICERYRHPDLDAPFGRALPPAPHGAAELAVAGGSLGAVRAFVAEQARRADLDVGHAGDLAAAVNELATNTLAHGGGGGVLRAWTEAGHLICEVADAGRITAPLVGRLLPALDGERGRGLWLANQLCDLVQIRSRAEGTLVRVHVRL